MCRCMLFACLVHLIYIRCADCIAGNPSMCSSVFAAMLMSDGFIMESPTRYRLSLLLPGIIIIIKDMCTVCMMSVKVVFAHLPSHSF